jgi:uncharacterized Rmd1/YagE family protein
MKQERRADTEKYASEMSDEEEYEIEDVRYSYDAASLMSIDGEVVRMTSAKTCKQRFHCHQPKHNITIDMHQ